ncbi:MAG: hypothetical protein GX466_08325 [Candidatus Cloacimonetes bacterium]|nr:hypothetical protein [Candidatus Cloacimonadota bacterium]
MSSKDTFEICDDMLHPVRIIRRSEMPLDMRYESDEERILHEAIARLQTAYAEAAQPYLDRLATIRSTRPAVLMMSNEEFNTKFNAMME